MDAIGAQTVVLQLRDLVLHECDEGAHDQGRARPRDSGKLVAERLSGAGRHDEQDVLAPGDGFADVALVRAEVLEAEAGVEECVELLGRGRLGLGGSGDRRPGRAALERERNGSGRRGVGLVRVKRQVLEERRLDRHRGTLSNDGRTSQRPRGSVTTTKRRWRSREILVPIPRGTLSF